MRIKLKKRQVAALILAGLLLGLNFTMRYGIWKRIQHFSSDKVRYEKLALAYHLGGNAGIDYELKNLAKYDASAGDFVRRASAQIKKAQDIRLFIRSAMAEDRDKIKRLKTDRFILSSIIYLVLAGQALLNIRCWWKDGGHHFLTGRSPSEKP